ncbi:MAG: hypothetical protein H0W99_09135 [Acidobacteria bacterium]|nr:hypothetical protein [Acidobacteriota bacterium]
MLLARMEEQEFHSLERAFVRMHQRLGIREEDIPDVQTMSEQELEDYLEGIQQKVERLPAKQSRL